MKQNRFEFSVGPLPLHHRNSGPIAICNRGDTTVEVWFQRQEPLGIPRWRYEHSKQPLSGIPDIVASSSGIPPLIMDAKFRLLTGPTRSEETYKLLGYAENFRDPVRLPFLSGLLIFPSSSPDSSITTLATVDQGHISILGIGTQQADSSTDPEYLNDIIEQWIHL